MKEISEINKKINKASGSGAAAPGRPAPMRPGQLTAGLNLSND